MQPTLFYNQFKCILEVLTRVIKIAEKLKNQSVFEPQHYEKHTIRLGWSRQYGQPNGT